MNACMGKNKIIHFKGKLMAVHKSLNFVHAWDLIVVQN